MITDRDPEFIGTITALYREELGRDPDPGGLAVYLDFLRQGATGGQLRQILHDSPEGVAHRSQPSAPIPIVVLPRSTSLHLEVQGTNFVDAGGNRTVLNACDGFMDYRIWLDGGEGALLPFVQESSDLGFQARRVFMQGSKAQNQVMDLSPKEPRYYDQLRAFVDFENAHGQIVLATVYVDNQDVLSDLVHWANVADVLRGTPTLLSGFNQWTKNKSTFGPWDLPDPGMIWSRGSDIADTKVAPRGATASELHSTRISFERSLMDATASPINMRQNGATMCWMTEGVPFDQNSDPAWAWKLGRAYSIDWALAVFHDRQGQRGLLRTGRIRECAESWCRGMTI